MGKVLEYALTEENFQVAKKKKKKKKPTTIESAQYH